MGYIHVWCSGVYNNFSIDNFNIVNKDKDPNLTKPEFKSAVYEVPEDFVYEKIGYVYKDQETHEENTLSPYLAVPVVAVLCIATLVIILLVQNKRDKRGQQRNEETEN